MELECYPVAERPPEIVAGRPQRGWMERFSERHPYRCLPLTMANTTGWEILCPMAVTMEWNGGVLQSDITLKPDNPNPDFHHLVKSHFSHGVVTFHPGYLFRTPPGWSMWVMGPPNHVKDGIQPLAGLVETDWLPFPFTMNWHFTRPGRVRFEKGEPFCFITLVQDKPLAQMQPVIRRMDANPELRGQYDMWEKHRADFNAKIFRLDPEATKEAWQRYYFRGEFPEDIAPAPEGHVNKRRLKTPRFGG
ncbi:DUF6065 family protein [Phenylobacterium sp.]|uniref:DUF6065 family protein n=1 Tax=Phenylobacterium sp. TaxID=1871053 RepID=UPI0027352027|nr:DUF6065 family protein [Phenylobacterium sp.]MDP3175721.1 DUF6065 family protein [Phenylobacterium sp.]MDP3660921.1 DUF6065 family protein [Phenylobacterium sp.]